jgi:hypothetical protein
MAGKRKTPTATSGIKPTTFWVVVECLKDWDKTAERIIRIMHTENKTFAKILMFR